ncbi:MAG: DNA-binding protein [Candidatus Nanohaloarchaea archaeon]|nr:DNA-binding protein [Candidatus Nanohaloarchaea archaeon]
MSDDLEELKKKKMQEMQQGSGSEQLQEQQKEQARKKLKKIASQILTKEARSRLGNIRAAKPDLASQIEMQLVQLYRMGQINDKITDEQLKELLKKIQESDEDSPDIKYNTGDL